MMVLKKAGALRNGREFSARRPVWHAVETADIYSCTPALCGASPRIQWTDSQQPREVTCARCRIKLADRDAPANHDNGEPPELLACRAELESVTIDLRVATEQGYRQAEERYRSVVAALRMGLQLGESGKHGDGENCPTCHFVRVARKALASIHCTDITQVQDR